MERIELFTKDLFMRRKKFDENTFWNCVQYYTTRCKSCRVRTILDQIVKGLVMNTVMKSEAVKLESNSHIIDDRGGYNKI